jgi:hypothetical protein
MSCYLLLLSFKQKCAPSEKSRSDHAEAVGNQKSNSEPLFQKQSSTDDHVCGLVSLLVPYSRNFEHDVEDFSSHALQAAWLLGCG